MTNRLILLVLFSSLVAAQTPAAPSNPSGAAVSQRTRAIHESAIVVDTHADTPQRFLDENFDLGSTDPNDAGHLSLDKARRGNLGAEFFSIWVDPETNQGHFARHTFDLIDVSRSRARKPQTAGPAAGKITMWGQPPSAVRSSNSALAASS